jgi:hypothetical protein
MKLLNPPEKVIASTAIRIPVLIEADSACNVDELHFSSLGQNTGSKLTVFDPPGGTFQNFSVPLSTTQIFIVRTNKIDTFNYSINLYKDGNNLSVNGSVDFLDPSFLIVTGQTDIVASERFAFNIEISNPQTYSIITYYSLSYDSIFSLTGGNSLSDTIELAPGEKRTLKWNMNISGDYEYGSGNIKFQNGNNYDALSIAAEFCPPDQEACAGVCQSDTGICCNNVWMPDAIACPEPGGNEISGNKGGGGSSGGGSNESEVNENYTGVEPEYTTTTTITQITQQEEKTTPAEKTGMKVDLTYIIIQLMPFIILIIILISMIAYIYRKYRGRMFEQFVW